MSTATGEASEIMSRIEEHLANARKGVMDYDMLKILEEIYHRPSAGIWMGSGLAL